MDTSDPMAAMNLANNLTTWANTFATIMQLVCNFRQEVAGRKTAEMSDLMAWMENHRFEEIKAAIQGNASLQIEIQELLNRNVADVREKINVVNEAVATIASRIDGFAGIAKAMGVNRRLSDQALRILKSFDESGAIDLAVYLTSAVPQCALTIGGRSKGIRLDDPRFLATDIQSLKELGFVTHSHYGGRGDPIYSITRSGSDFAKSAT